MARIELAPEIRDDFDRILGHLTERAVEDAPGRIRELSRQLTYSNIIRLLEDPYPLTRES